MLGINIGVMKGLCRHYIRVIQGMYWDNGKENGNYYLGFRTMTMTLFQPNKILRQTCAAENHDVFTHKGMCPANTFKQTGSWLAVPF